jgi:peroxiredoxin/TolA-binding protein
MIVPAPCVCLWLSLLGVAQAQGAAPGEPAAGLGQSASASSDVAILLEMNKLAAPDETIEDDAQRRQALLKNVRKIPQLLQTFEKDYPKSKYLGDAYSITLEALIFMQQMQGGSVTAEQIGRAAKRLLEVTQDDRMRAQGSFVLLELEADQKIKEHAKQAATASAPAGASRPAMASAPSRVPPPLTSVGDGFLKLARQYPQTIYAPMALYQGAGYYLESAREDLAIAAMNQLAKDYPKDPLSLKAVMVLVQLHSRRDEAALATSAKKRCVEQFPDSAAAAKYKADIALEESLSKPFFLRFRSVDGQQVDVQQHKGKPVLVYFFGSLSDEKLGQQTLKELAELAALAKRHGAALIAVGADESQDAEVVAKKLKDSGLAVPTLLDAEGKVAENYGVMLLPSVGVVGTDGKLHDIAPSIKQAAAALTALPATASRPAAKAAP